VWCPVDAAWHTSLSDSPLHALNHGLQRARVARQQPHRLHTPSTDSPTAVYRTPDGHTHTTDRHIGQPPPLLALLAALRVCCPIKACCTRRTDDTCTNSRCTLTAALTRHMPQTHRLAVSQSPWTDGQDAVSQVLRLWGSCCFGPPLGLTASERPWWLKAAADPEAGALSHVALSHHTNKTPPRLPSQPTRPAATNRAALATTRCSHDRFLLVG
jgi:hypothetical protein